MNQEQIKMGMKINKKINNKINKKIAKNNNKHGNLLENQETLKKLGVPDGCKHYNDMLNILDANSDNMFIKKFNKWHSSLPEIYNATGGYINKFFNYCFDKFRSINPSYTYDSKTHKIRLDRPSEESSDDSKKILDAVPINPTEIEQKEISKLKDEAIRLNKIKETVDDAEDKKEKHEKTLKELSDKLEESQDEQREELNKKLKEKKEKKSVQKEDNLMDYVSEMIRANEEQNLMETNDKEAKKVKRKEKKNKERKLMENEDKHSEAVANDKYKRKTRSDYEQKLMEKNDEESKISTANNKKLKEEIKNQLKTIKKAEPEEIKVKPKVKQEEITEPKLPVEKMVDRFRNTRHNIFTGDINQQMFMNFLTTIISDGKYADLLKKIRIENEKHINKKGTAIKEIQELMKNNNFLDVTHQCKLFERDLKDYMKNCFPDFKKGDELPINENQFRREIRNLIRRNISLGAHNQAKLQHSINKKLSKRGLPMISISGDRNGTINVNNYKEYEKNMRERSQGKIDTDPSNSKTFFSYDIHEIFNIVEKGLNNKLSTDAKNDIESIVKMETSNIINHANISHGASKIQNIIVEIERYLSSRMRNKSKTFKFTESNRYKLKELLSRFLNDKNGQE